MNPPAATANKPVDAAVRAEIRTNVEENLLVEAGAGTGKTTSLVGRIVEILASGHATVDELAVITFTHKAAAELSARVREELELAIEAEDDPAKRERLAEAARGLYRARVETIHSFASALLRERPVEAGLDPEFRALDGLEETLLFDRLFGDWLADLLAEPRPEIETAVNLGLGPDLLKQATRAVHDHRYLLPLTPHKVEAVDGSEVAEWIEANRAELEGIANRCNNEENPQFLNIARVLEFGERLRVEGSHGPSLARLVARGMPWVSVGGGSQGDWDDPADSKRWKKELGSEYQALYKDVPVRMRAAALASVVPLIEDFVRDYEQHRRGEGLADFDDLIIWARDLVRDRPEVRDYFRGRFKAILIDEFQDTDPIQVELAMLLASDGQGSADWRELVPAPGKLFLVGDPKQSIYRFRRADIGIYDEVKAGPLDNGLREIVQNFRSVPGVIAWVNDVFDRLFEERPGLQPHNVALRDSGFEQGLDRPPVVVMRGRDPDALAGAVREQEADGVAAVLHEAIAGAEPWPVRDRVSGKLREPTWRDVAILLPRRTGLEAYESALGELDIPYRHEGSRDYFEREEVRDLVFLLQAIDDPRDRVSLIGALRSGAFGCSDDDLVIHAATANSKWPWSYRARDIESESERVMEAFGFLRQLHYAREKLSLPLLVQRAVAESRLVEVALTGRDGAQAAANLLAIVERARTFAAAGGGSPRAFTRWLRDNIEQEASEVDAGISEETDEVVRIMTMHGAKGLEFPIVVLGGLGGQGKDSREPVPDEADSQLHFHVGNKDSGFGTPGYEARLDAEKEALALEDIRLLYVAATRARDHLVIPDFEGKRDPGRLLASLQPLLPEGDAHEEEIDGVWMLDAAQIERPASVEEEGRRIKAAEAKAALAERESWHETQEALVKDAREGLELEVASSVKRTVRPLASEASHSDAAMLVSEGPPLEIGDALHKVMEKVSLPDAEDLEPWTAAICAEFGIPEHADEVTELARRCLASATVKRAIGSGSYRREVPFVLPIEHGFLAGRVDLIVRDGPASVLMDFKTNEIDPDTAEAHAAEHYSDQARHYVEGISQAAGADIDRVVLVYCRSGVEVTLRNGLNPRSAN